MQTNPVFLHGLESSSQGTKARWLKEHFPHMVIPDFSGELDKRLKHLDSILTAQEKLTMIGSSFGGLMATIFGLENPTRVDQVILLAPALNFPDFSLYQGRSTRIPTQLYIGKNDTVCPPEIVLPLARQTFQNLITHESNDDHMLRNTFEKIDWWKLIGE